MYCFLLILGTLFFRLLQAGSLGDPSQKERLSVTCPRAPNVETVAQDAGDIKPSELVGKQENSQSMAVKYFDNSKIIARQATAASATVRSMIISTAKQGWCS